MNEIYRYQYTETAKNGITENCEMPFKQKIK